MLSPKFDIIVSKVEYEDNNGDRKVVTDSLAFSNKVSCTNFLDDFEGKLMDYGLDGNCDLNEIEYKIIAEYDNKEENFEGTEDFSIQPMSPYSWNLVSDKHRIYEEMSRRARNFINEGDGKKYFMTFF